MGTFIGVYSSSPSGPKGGRGAGRRKQYWFVWDYDDEGYRVQALDAAFQPQGDFLPVAHATFHASFAPEPSILAAPIRRPVPAAPPSRRAEQAAVEQAVSEKAIVENHLRAHFGALLLKLRRGDDIAGALQALRDIADVEEGIVPEHKYMFADFGVNLRKGKLPEIALAHAKRVLALAPGDSHAHFNIARIYHALGKLGDAEQHLLTALEFSPDLGCARDFLVYFGKERHRMEFDARRQQRW
jgi:tetratricopeptide (TPR) repeat protein